MQEGHSELPLSFWKQEMNFLCERYSPCTRRKRELFITKERIEGWEACINKLCYFLTYLLPRDQTSLSSQSFTNVLFQNKTQNKTNKQKKKKNVLFLCPKNITDTLFGHFFESHIFMRSYTYEVEFVFLLLIYLISI